MIYKLVPRKMNGYSLGAGDYVLGVPHSQLWGVHCSSIVCLGLQMFNLFNLYIQNRTTREYVIVRVNCSRSLFARMLIL